jgi:MFS transporter, UMF1 family
MAAVLPIFFRKIAWGGAGNLPTAIWGYTTTLAMLLSAGLALLFGPIADSRGRKKHYLLVFTLIGSLASSLTGLAGYGDWIWVIVFYVLADIGFSTGEVFYDSLLPHLAPVGDIDRISSQGYALGYVGGGLLLVLNAALIALLPKTLSPSGEYLPVWGMRLSLMSVGVWWALFSIPLFKKVPEPFIDYQPPSPAFMTALRRLAKTFHEIKRYRNAFLFILAFWLYNDGIGTIIIMATAYGDELGIGTLPMLGALLLTQFIGLPSSIGFGRLAGRIGAKRGILIGLAVYLGIATGGFFISRTWHFWALAACVGLVQGGTQALSRSFFAVMIPKNRSAEFFSFYTISGKFAGILGPTVFALTSQLAGSSRFGILSLILFFLAGGAILLRVQSDPSDLREDKV